MLSLLGSDVQVAFADQMLQCLNEKMLILDATVARLSEFAKHDDDGNIP